jgi:hypothetical protein
MIRVLSLGAGVQSSALAFMCEVGEFGRPDVAVFADTQAEPASVYQWLEYLKRNIRTFSIENVTRGDLTKDSLHVRTSTKSGRRYMTNKLPFFVLNPDGTVGLNIRKCTLDYKVVPIQRFIRARFGKQPCTVMMGISLDEASRMKDSRVGWIQHEYPLIDKRMTRLDCLNWMQRHGLPEPPRSACVYCPFHSDAEWARLRDNEPAEFLKAVTFEREMQATATQQDAFRGVPYLHDSCKPLDQIDFENKRQLKLWNNECTGMCGV